jgi:murein DD-endopeptidase MepM/ murein hydrolase activator NlpD
VRSYPRGVRHDYKDPASAPAAGKLGTFDLSRIDPRTLSPRKLSWFAAGFVLPLVGVVLLLVSAPNESMVPSAAATVPSAAAMVPAETRVLRESPPAKAPLSAMVLLPPSGERVRLELPPPQTQAAAAGQLTRPEDLQRSALLAQGEALTLTVKSGDTLDRMFRRNDLSIADLAIMIRLPEASDHLTTIRPGDRFEIIRDGERVLSLSREISDAQELWIKRNGEGYGVELIDLEIELRTAGAHGIIDGSVSSLWEAASAAGLEGETIEEIGGIFAWDIDFALEVRTGDSFTVVYEEIWRDGQKLRNGSIVAAEFVNQRRVYRAARYIDANGDDDYYTPDGMNVRRPFLRAPLDVFRVSSNFNPNRRHPILNTIRAHRGVDYAAPTNTIIKAAGEGKIIALGANGSFGNRVEIQHGGNITTLYAHLNKFGKYRVGDRVTQGDIIGYVGMTGGATGPHLHYEYRINGVHQDPRTVDLPDAQPIDREYLADFELAAAPLWRQLDLYQGTLLASNAD